MKMYRFVPVILAFLVLCSAPKAEAFCANDGWGSLSAGIFIMAPQVVFIRAQGELSHTGQHPTCFGQIHATANLSSAGPACSRLRTAEHLPGDSTESVTAEEACNVQCGLQYSTNAEFSWNDATDFEFVESPTGVFFTCPGTCFPEGGPPIEGCVWSEIECDWVDCCPLVFDTSGKGYKLTSADRGVWFDINADGQQDAISWTDPSRDVAFLAFDRNRNGGIDHGEELFGNVTPLPAGGDQSRASHGFDALASLESGAYGPSRMDGIIDAWDAAFQNLLFWKDINHDGVSQPEELVRASAAGLLAIETRHRESKRRDEFGNEFRLRGISWWDRQGRLDARLFYDVWFVPRR